MPSNDSARNIKVKSTAATVIAIILLAVYFTGDFIIHRSIPVFISYIIIIIFCTWRTVRKDSFFKSVYILIILFFAGFFLRQAILNWTDFDWFQIAFMKRFDFVGARPEMVKRIFSAPYMYFYIAGLVLLLVAVITSVQTRWNYIMRVLGTYSLWALIFQVVGSNFKIYESLQDIVFFVFAVSAFWTAYTTDKFTLTGVWKAVALTVLIGMTDILFADEYTELLHSFQKIYDTEWYFSLGLALITFICILTRDVREDNLIGCVLLGTNLIMFLSMNKNIVIESVMLLFFHIAAISAYQYIRYVFCPSENLKIDVDHRIIGVFCYTGSFLLTTFIIYHFTEAIVIFFIGLLVLFLYYGNYVDLEGKICGTVLLGTIPWILLETTMALSGQLPSSLFAAAAVTVIFWCLCGIALSWKNSSYINSIVLEKTNAKAVVTGLSTAAYFLTAISLLI